MTSSVCYIRNCKQVGTRRDNLNGLVMCDSCFTSEKFFLSEYKVKGSRFPSYFRCSPEQLDDVLSRRGLGECDHKRRGDSVIGITRAEVGNKFYEKLSDRLLGKSEIDLEDIHAACLLSFIGYTSGAISAEEVLNDKGLLHEMIHRALYPEEPLIPNKEEIVKVIQEIESKIPGGVFL